MRRIVQLEIRWEDENNVTRIRQLESLDELADYLVKNKLIEEVEFRVVKRGGTIE